MLCMLPVPPLIWLPTPNIVPCRQGLTSGSGVQEEEAARIAEEEEARMAVEKEQRKADRAARRAEAKRQGLLLTGKAKKEAERLAAIREQLLRDSGVDVGGASPGKASLRKYSCSAGCAFGGGSASCYLAHISNDHGAYCRG